MRKIHHLSILAILLSVSIAAFSQEGTVLASTKTLEISADPKVRAEQNVVVITGNRFSYPLIQKWIDDYNKVNSNVQIIIESRGTNDPAQYDILAEVYPPDDEIKKNREYLNVARYAILPVANSKSAFAKTYTGKGLTRELINQIFFHDIFADNEKQQKIKPPYTIYTRLQKAGAPIVFTKYFGYEQKDIKGKAIAGADEHLLKAILRDSLGVSYLPLSLIYDIHSKQPVDGIVVLPVDLNDNGRVNEDEKFYKDLETVITRIEKDSKEINNIPVGYLHLSIDKNNSSSDAIEFLQWVMLHGQNALHDFGFLKTEGDESDKFNEFVSKRK
jgi:phosphate transport system substrate-binding protein